jgi:hypothetical protein
MGAASGVARTGGREAVLDTSIPSMVTRPGPGSLPACGAWCSFPFGPRTTSPFPTVNETSFRRRQCRNPDQVLDGIVGGTAQGGRRMALQAGGRAKAAPLGRHDSPPRMRNRPAISRWTAFSGALGAPPRPYSAAGLRRSGRGRLLALVRTGTAHSYAQPTTDATVSASSFCMMCARATPRARADVQSSAISLFLNPHRLSSTSSSRGVSFPAELRQ